MTVLSSGVAVVVVVLATGCQEDRTASDRVQAVGGRRPSAAASQRPEPRVTAAVVPADPAPARGSDDWRMTRFAEDGQIEGYTTRSSAPPGVPVELKVSTAERAYRVSAYRIGAYDGGTGHLVDRSELVAGRRQPGPVLQPAETRTVVAPWDVSVTLDTEGWEPGFYVFRLARIRSPVCRGVVP